MALVETSNVDSAFDLSLTGSTLPVKKEPVVVDTASATMTIIDVSISYYFDKNDANSSYLAAWMLL